ncbi:SDR family NAD(P)-dependent oxidoreductase [Cellulomonas fimi]|uniref:Short-chain dehydrogenase/reductase SDR n=1 Tax=Cellulomonas fimi (strain ATCC 484 / DSM 20113 / JCM 1341 / CCUG 24087 / LMG 16345 / NBRC 15513 / NCIMB 8980 / NCTC 7547 / NRS-133) TaxID=590998 RepID=F4H030_CELFA|nr:SDR family oxidoreductase [Cellulomonas fimi]AEE44952.1 short-chain dehydrogenase/reductase SDR [Cellulomonas fimi ATCC 484]NNH07225.1 SDR family oxidoreductase [Cellulomonas fimi]VEH27778.1 3-oxoacyl-[acyl-carrier-protein] reductase FabG [Cellulomonas fimi]
MARQVLITGGTRGIGRATAARFVALGDDVLVTGRGPDVAATARQVGARGIRLDLEDPESVGTLRDDLDAVDVVVNNAGGFVGPPPPAGAGLADVAAHWHRGLAVNLVGAVLVVTALEDRLRAGGAVVSVGSIGAEYAGNPYSVAKAALQAWSVGLSERLGPRDVTVNAVAPGYVEGTDLFGGPLDAERRRTLVGRTSLGRPATPEDVAGTVVFLASADARHLTGQTVHVNGGARTTR